MIVVKFNRFYAMALMLLGLREGHQTYKVNIKQHYMLINFCKFYGEQYKPSRSNFGVPLGIEPPATFCFVSQLSNSHLQATRLTKIK